MGVSSFCWTSGAHLPPACIYHFEQLWTWTTESYSMMLFQSSRHCWSSEFCTSRVFFFFHHQYPDSLQRRILMMIILHLPIFQMTQVYVLVSACSDLCYSRPLLSWLLISDRNFWTSHFATKKHQPSCRLSWSWLDLIFPHCLVLLSCTIHFVWYLELDPFIVSFENFQRKISKMARTWSWLTLDLWCNASCLLNCFDWISWLSFVCIPVPRQECICSLGLIRSYLE